MKFLALTRSTAAVLPAFATSTGGSIAASSIPMAGLAISATTAASKIGDLSPSRVLAVDVLAWVEKGDLGAATKPIKDFEIAWDGAEAVLKPRAVIDWTGVDKAIDRASTELRAGKPATKAGAQSLKDALAVIDAVN